MSATINKIVTPGRDTQGITKDAAISDPGVAASVTATGSTSPAVSASGTAAAVNATGTTIAASPMSGKRGGLLEIWVDNKGESMDGSPKVSSVTRAGSQVTQIPDKIQGITATTEPSSSASTYAKIASSPPRSDGKSNKTKGEKSTTKKGMVASKSLTDFATLASGEKKKKGKPCLGDFIPSNRQEHRGKKLGTPKAGGVSGAHQGTDQTSMEVDLGQEDFVLPDYKDDDDESTDGSISTSVDKMTFREAFGEDDEVESTPLYSSTPIGGKSWKLTGGVGRTPPQNLFKKKFSALPPPKNKINDNPTSKKGMKDANPSNEDHKGNKKRKRSERRQRSRSTKKVSDEDNASLRGQAGQPKQKSQSAKKRDGNRIKDFTANKIRESRERSKNISDKSGERSSSLNEQPPDKRQKNTCGGDDKQKKGHGPGSSDAGCSRASSGRPQQHGGSQSPSQQGQGSDRSGPSQSAPTNPQANASMRPAGNNGEKANEGQGGDDNSDPKDDDVVMVDSYAEKLREERKVVILHSSRSLNMNDFIEIQGLVTDFLIDDGLDCGPKIEKALLREGAIILYCEDKEAVQVFKYTVSKLELKNEKGCNLRALDYMEAKNYFYLCCRVSDPMVAKDYEKFASRLLFYNPSLRNNYFAVVGDIVRPKDKFGAILKVRGDSSFLDALKELNMSPSYGFGNADFWPLTKRAPNSHGGKHNNKNKKKRNNTARAQSAQTTARDGEAKKH